MLLRWLFSLLAFFALCGLFALAVWGIDRCGTIMWIGCTNLDVDFHVTAAGTEEPIPEARIEIQSEGAFYDGAREENPNFELGTDATGMARHQCRNNRCLGTQSGLRFTDTYHVYIPNWRARALAVGFEPSAWVDLHEDYRGKVQHEGPQKDRLVVRISLQKAPAEPNAIPVCGGR